MSSSSSSSSSSSELPYFCPRCGDGFRFSSVPELRAHLVIRHTYETLLVLSQARVRSSRPGALLPLPGQAASRTQSRPLAVDTRSLPLTCLDLASPAASMQLLGDTFSPCHRSVPSSAGRPEEPSTALALPGSLQPHPGKALGDAAVRLGLELGLSVGIGLEERLGLGLDHKIARTFAEVEERVNRRVSRLKAELQRREAELELRRRDEERLRSEKQEVEERAAYLSRQVSAAVEMMEQLKKDLEGKERELRERQQEMVDIECFLRDTAEKEAEAKCRLQVFIETLLERADLAERQLLLLTTHTHHGRRYAHAEGDAPVPGRGGRSLDGSTDDIIANKMRETIGNRRSYSVSGSYRLGEQLRSQHPYRFGEGGSGRTWTKRNHRHHSTEEEEEEEEEEEAFWSCAEMRRLDFAKTHTPGSETPSSFCSTPTRCHSDKHLGADALRLRAGLFCVFPYLDVHSLLCAAEVCSDWRFVARHPAVWMRLRLENARVSAEFLSTLSQWCTQTQSVVLNNLKPRSRRADESREDYHKNTRGSLEPGVEALLRSAGGSLLHLSVSQCPHILTDRTLWLASCYCRNLRTLTYRSSSDPLSQEVLWALGAGCRNIIGLQVAPAHPCQQPTRFGNHCLQTIGRCWPHLRSVSVGGASCGTQGLVALVRSCAELQVLVLERITDLGLQVATELCKAGLRSLETLILTHTPVSGQAILHFHSVCANVRAIRVVVSVADYFEEPDTQEAQHLFGEILATLKVLQKRPGLCDVLQVQVEGFC
uniref:F-box only protein 41-like isoform X1 n=1 Tax=Scatophagus argus TaxID=75038 RepID=UPI001ED8466C|nr:F-box only protein 41-like isoform X1 [Scatophagus argus]XP_046236039.1 F-box only protein 41-like isoform X1 [Scatophagus argus]XP_046236040.1 F-box only protein 41-like isoform X1 [Scatophagus argus]XP_046236041.1 F-box only protein 41-like isoform X1 [Scatophagus argus]XP_046236042.1 F-box only protein 41-like isoform X1 [Scatophagus argus]XP_046236043.1 F-box only protein 41-like isoform X1 [Scatophagus argus]